MDNVTRDAVAARLKQARIAAGYATAAEAARALHMKEATVRAHESGQNAIGMWNGETYAKHYGVSHRWLFYGHEEKPTKFEIEERVADEMSQEGHRRASVPILGEVAAGLWKEIQPQERSDATGEIQIRVDGYARQPLYALRVVGNSMNLYYPEGRYLIVAPAVIAGLRQGDHVIVQRAKAGLVETTCKELVIGEEGIAELWPRSNDPAFQEPIIMAGTDGDQDAPIITGVVVADYNRRLRTGLPIGSAGDDA